MGEARHYHETLRKMLDEGGFQAHAGSDAWSGMEAQWGEKFYADALFHLTRMDFNPQEAKGYWLDILNHHERLTALLGRPVGLRTVVCDYFLSLKPIFDAPIVVETRLLLRSEQYALMDELTGLHNRRFFNLEMRRELERARRDNLPVSLLMLDVDYFKRYNDIYGHLAGDDALAGVADILRKNARVIDHVVRYGGEEFAIILPGADRNEAAAVAERHRMAVENHGFRCGRLTVSIGASTFPEDGDTELALTAKADSALYRAKRLGRNLICVETKDMRAHPRVPISLPVECCFPALARGPVNGRTVNLSPGGMLFQSDLRLGSGLHGEALLALPKDAKTLRLQVKTVRMYPDPRQGGVYFVGLAFAGTPVDAALLGSFIEAGTADPSTAAAGTWH